MIILSKEILDFIRKERVKYNNDVDDAEDFLYELSMKVEERYNIPCTYFCTHSFDGGPGYEATSYVIVAFYDGKFLFDTLLKELY
jgi:hypothetical protein